MLRRLAGLSHNRLLDFEVLADCLGHGGVNPLDLHLRPRGYRALAQIPRLTERQIAAVVGSFDGLDSILRASLRELEACEGIAPPRPATSARDCAACRSTTSWIATCSSKARSKL